LHLISLGYNGQTERHSMYDERDMNIPARSE